MEELLEKEEWNDTDLEKGRGWKPNPKQEIFLALPYEIKEGMYGGGAGSGKSDVLLYYPIVHRFYQNPRFKQVFARRTFPELRNEIVPRSRDIFTRFGATFNKSDMAWTFPRVDQLGGTGLGNAGAIVFLGHCENEEDVHKYDSMEINLFTPDELTSFTEWIYLYIGFQRVRTSDPSLPAIIRGAGMPGGIGHTWVNRRFVKPWPAGGKVIEGRAGVLRIFIHSTQADNKHIDPKYAQSLAALPDAERNAKLYGDFNAYLGSVFDEFRVKHYTGEPENAVHVIPKFDIPDWWPKFLIGDWGFAAQTYLLKMAVSPTRRVYAYGEMSFRKKRIEEWAPYARYIIETEHPRAIKFCRSSGQDRGQQQTIQQQIEEALGCPIELSDNSAGSRIAGKQLLHEFLRWRPKEVIKKEQVKFNQEHAAWLYRNRGIREYQEYVKLFEPAPPEENLPKLQIFENECPLLVQAIQAAQYAKSDKSGVPAEDVAEFDGDDPYDTIRYGLDEINRYFEETSKEFERLKEQEAIAKQLAETKDYTAYYMRLRRMEDVNRGGKQFGVRRYHH